MYICICRAGYVVALILRHLNRRFDIHCNNSLSEGAGALTFVAAVQRSSLEVYVAIDCRFFFGRYICGRLCGALVYRSAVLACKVY